jgi:hypothetical protein
MNRFRKPIPRYEKPGPSCPGLLRLAAAMITAMGLLLFKDKLKGKKCSA